MVTSFWNYIVFGLWTCTRFTRFQTLTNLMKNLPFGALETHCRKATDWFWNPKNLKESNMYNSVSLSISLSIYICIYIYIICAYMWEWLMHCGCTSARFSASSSFTSAVAVATRSRGEPTSPKHVADMLLRCFWGCLAWDNFERNVAKDTNENVARSWWFCVNWRSHHGTNSGSTWQYWNQGCVLFPWRICQHLAHL